MDHDIFAAIFVNLDTDRATRAAVKEHFSNDSTIEATLNRLARIADRELITMQEVTVSIQETDMPRFGTGQAVGTACRENIMDGRDVNEGGRLFCRPRARVA